MRMRKRLTRSKSRKSFRRTADRTHKFNVRARPSRGGITL